jgi:hypothetical protein
MRRPAARRVDRHHVGASGPQGRSPVVLSADHGANRQTAIEEHRSRFGQLPRGDRLPVTRIGPLLTNFRLFFEAVLDDRKASPPSVRMRSLRNGERHYLGLLLGDTLMDGAYQFDPDLVWPGWQQGHVDRSSTHVRPQPREVVHVYVQMSNPWRRVEVIPAELRPK